MSQKSSDKSDALVLQFLSKTAQIIVQSRLSPSQYTTNGKRNKWFNLELEDIDVLKDELRFWKGQYQSGSRPPLMIDILLDISSVQKDQSIILRNKKTGHGYRILNKDLMVNGTPLKKEKILLESWQLTIAPLDGLQYEKLELPSIYKKCIVFFRTLYFSLRLMPASLLRKSLEKQQSCKVSYRVSSSRVSSPLDAGLDQLHPENEDMRLGLDEMDFESIETPLGVFRLHATYRTECDYSVEPAKTDLPTEFEMEPQFFRNPSIVQNIAQLQRQHSTGSNPSSFSPPSSSSQQSLKDPRRKLSLSSRNRMPNTGVYIPNSNYKDLQTSFNTGSPDAYFTGAPFSASVGKSVSSTHFQPFTPPTATYPITGWRKDILDSEAPPFSTERLSDADKFSLEKNSILGASPPFAMQDKIEEKGAQGTQGGQGAQLLSMIRKPSYVFPSSSNPINFTANRSSPLLFTPGSSYSQPFFRSFSPSQISPNEAAGDVEHYIATIEQNQSLKLSGLGSSNNSKSNLVFSSPGIRTGNILPNPLDRLRNFQKENAAFAHQVDLRLGDERSKLEENPPLDENQSPFALLQDSIDIPKSNFHPFDAISREARLNSSARFGMSRQRSLTFDPHNSSKGGAEFGTSSTRSESLRGRNANSQSHSEDDDLLFNMSDLNH